MKRFFSTSLQGKLSVMMLISTVIPLFFLGAFSYITSARVNEEKTKQIGMDSLRRIQGTLQFIAQDVEGMSIFLTGDKDVQQYMSGFDFDSPERSRILAMTLNLIQSKEYISNITIYSKNKTMPLHTQSIYFSNLSKVIEDWDLSGKRWTSLYDNQTVHGSEHVFSFLRAVKSGDNYEQLGFISISINEAVLSRYLGSPNFGVGQGDILLLNRQDKVISGNNKQWLTQSWSSLFPDSLLPGMTQQDGFFNYGEGHDKKTVLYNRIPGLDWTLIGLVPYELYSKENRYIWILTGTSVSLAAVLTSGLILFFVRHVTKPLIVLRRHLVRFNPDEPMPLYQFESLDEVGQLVGSYNKLGEHIKRLKEQLIKLETRKKEADIRALQAQINPHFLYNTLSSVHWMALMNREQRIADMVGALSDFLRFSLNKGKDYCTVQQEINHVKNYSLIQSIRYPKRFHIHFQIDPKLGAWPMLKLLLQPLVENAMMHGLKKNKKHGTIYISAVQEPRGMRFTVHDDGVGIAEDKLNKLLTELQQPIPTDTGDSSGGYGLRNVNERLLLHYGYSSQLLIESQEGQGTRISFIIPVKEHEYEDFGRG
jgi:two-component system sensor histidine kinase YesM